MSTNTIISDVKSLFIELDSTYCPITACQIKSWNTGTNACLTSYTVRGDGTDVSLTGSNPWPLVMPRDYAPGYSNDVCFTCDVWDPASGSSVSLTTGKVTVTQTEVDCTTVLTQKSTLPSEALVYSTDTNQVATRQAYSDFFDNSDSSGICNIQSCVLKAGGCGSAYVAGYLSIDTTAGVFQIKADYDIVSGYTETACVQCTNAQYGHAY